MQNSEHLFQQKSFSQLRPVAILCKVIATLACLVILLLVDIHHDVPSALYFSVILAGLCCWAATKVRSVGTLFILSTTVLAISAGCLAQVALIIGHADYWLLPIGLMLSLPSAAIHIRPLHYLLSGALIWATDFYVIQPQFERPLDALLTLLAVGGALLTGVAVCSAYRHIRRTVFELQQQLHALAYQDTLTGLPNRRAFMEEVERTGGRGFFLKIDIDDFKQINDRLGHAACDQVLVEVGKILRATSPRHPIARLGGEEFAVAACVPDLAGAQLLAQAIVDAVHALQTHGLPLSVSIGVAERRPGEAAASWMHRADGALYAAKMAGKNRFVAVD